MALNVIRAGINPEYDQKKLIVTRPVTVKKGCDKKSMLRRTVLCNFFCYFGNHQAQTLQQAIQ